MKLTKSYAWVTLQLSFTYVDHLCEAWGSILESLFHDIWDYNKNEHLCWIFNAGKKIWAHDTERWSAGGEVNMLMDMK